MDQLSEAIRLTKSKITVLEAELSRERDFLARLIPREVRGADNKRRNSNRQNWSIVLQALTAKPMRHEHVIDFIDTEQIPISRGAVRVWLCSRTSNSHLKRDHDGFYSVSVTGADYLRKALA